MPARVLCIWLSVLASFGHALPSGNNKRDAKRTFSRVLEVPSMQNKHCAEKMLNLTNRWGMRFEQCVDLCRNTSRCEYLTFVSRNAPGPDLITVVGERDSDCLLYPNCYWSSRYMCKTQTRTHAGCHSITYKLSAVQFPVPAAFCDHTPILNVRHRYGITPAECEKRCIKSKQCKYFTAVPHSAPCSSGRDCQGMDCLHWAECPSLHEYRCARCQAVTYAIVQKLTSLHTQTGKLPDTAA